jgi:hypothetical protein
MGSYGLRGSAIVELAVVGLSRLKPLVFIEGSRVNKGV